MNTLLKRNYNHNIRLATACIRIDVPSTYHLKNPAKGGIRLDAPFTYRLLLKKDPAKGGFLWLEFNSITGLLIKGKKTSDTQIAESVNN